MKKLPRNTADDDAEEQPEELLDVKTSKRILELSREQMREVEEERVRNSSNAQKKVVQNDDDSSDEESDEEIEIEDDLVQHDEGYVTMSNTGLTPEEEALLSNMMSGSAGEDEPQRKTLADIIMEKIEEKEAMADMPDHGEYEAGVELPAKVIQVRIFIAYMNLCFMKMEHTSTANHLNRAHIIFSSSAIHIGLHRHWQATNPLHVR